MNAAGKSPGVRKLPRSSLSQMLGGGGADVQSQQKVGSGLVGGPLSEARTLSDSGEVGNEIKRIFQGVPGQGGREANRCSIFGCSPPMRSSNPLERDSNFMGETDPVERLIEAGHFDTCTKEGFKEVMFALSPPGPGVCSCNSN